MRPIRAVAIGCGVLLGLAGPAQAGWQSVFQVCNFGHSVPTVAGYGPTDPCCNPCPAPCPQQVCTTRYIQRCYYQPVTTYQTKTYYEPVTTYRTSYYCEPVTCYRYTCCYDPCTCTYRQVATPYTTYRMKSMCCPVQSWVQRCCSVPVTTYKQCFYYEPQTCCTLVDPCAGNGATAAAVTPAPVPATPRVIESQTPAAAVPGVQEYRNGGSGSRLYDQQYWPPAQVPMTPPQGSGSSYRYKTQRAPLTAPVPIARPKQPVVPKLERIALDSPSSTGQASLIGQVVKGNGQQPRAGIRLTFRSESQAGKEQLATADSTGKFHVTLASGGWSVYVPDEHGKPILHSTLFLKSDAVQHMTLVSR